MLFTLSVFILGVMVFAVAVVVRGVTLLGTASYTPPTAAAAVASACRDLARARLLPVFAQPAPLPLRFPDDVSGSGRNGAKHRDGCSLLNCFERFVVADDDADLIPDDKIQIGVDAD